MSVSGGGPKQAIARALFQARKLILRHWKSTEPPTVKEWIQQMGSTLRLEKHIYHHVGSMVGYSRPGPGRSCSGPDVITTVPSVG